MSLESLCWGHLEFKLDKRLYKLRRKTYGTVRVNAKANQFLVSCFLQEEHGLAPSVTMSREAHQLTRVLGSTRSTATHPSLELKQ